MLVFLLCVIQALCTKQVYLVPKLQDQVNACVFVLKAGKVGLGRVEKA